MKNERGKRILQIVAVTVFLLLVWFMASMLAKSELLLPSPISVFSALVSLAKTSSFYVSALMSLLRIMCGYIVGIIIGIVLGVLSARFKFANYIISPILSIIRATPVSSFIILVLLWLSTGTVPIFTAFLIVVPIIASSVKEGITSTDPLLVEMADFFEISRVNRMKLVLTSSVFPRLSAACITSLGFAWKAGVAAEVLATPTYSIGRGLYQSKIYLETSELFAWTLLVILMSLLLERLITALLARVGGVKRK